MQWEYTNVEVTIHDSYSANKEIAELGLSGWEAFCVTKLFMYDRTLTTWFFKRPIKEDPIK